MRSKAAVVFMITDLRSHSGFRNTQCRDRFQIREENMDVSNYHRKSETFSHLVSACCLSCLMFVRVCVIFSMQTREGVCGSEQLDSDQTCHSDPGVWVCALAAPAQPERRSDRPGRLLHRSRQSTPISTPVHTPTLYRENTMNLHIFMSVHHSVNIGIIGTFQENYCM